MPPRRHLIPRSLSHATMALAALLAAACTAPSEAPTAAVEKPQHMVAAANPLAAEAGMQMLRQGGSAVDAAIATALVLSLVEPQSSGIGGGAFLMHYDAGDRSVAAYDGRETAPSEADEALFLKADGEPMKFGTRWSAAVQWARPACCACWSWLTRNTAACPGPT